MFQLLKDPHFDFMTKRRFFVGMSLTFVVAALVIVFVRGVNLGIEFTGGTELQLRYVDRPEIGSIRSTLERAGMPGALVTTIGRPEENEVYIRLGSQETGGSTEDPTGAVLAALRGERGGVDINIEDADSLGRLLANGPGMSTERADEIGAAVLDLRRDRAVFRAHDDLAGVPGMTPELLQYVKAQTVVGPLALRSQSFIGPTVGRELVQKALLAILGSLVGMLIYIWIRFQVEWGVAAVLALIHDTVVTLGLFSLLQLELSLPVIAAFLTLIGYSVNDTVVIFDRVRENLANRRGMDLAALINLSVNQTLSRTILTSGLTWLVVVSLLIFGGATLRPFSFVLTVGMIAGTYSTVYIAGPFLVMWRNYRDRRRDVAAAAEGQPGAKAAPERRARKVRSQG